VRRLNGVRQLISYARKICEPLETSHSSR
jgi:hypothetical protein